MTVENTYFKPSGGRECLTCKRERNRIRAAKEYHRLKNDPEFKAKKVSANARYYDWHYEDVREKQAQYRGRETPEEREKRLQYHRDYYRAQHPEKLPEPKTHCVHGHELTPENLYVYVNKDGKVFKSCRICRRETAIVQARLRRLKRQKERQDPQVIREAREAAREVAKERQRIAAAKRRARRAEKERLLAAEILVQQAMPLDHAKAS